MWRKVGESQDFTVDLETHSKNFASLTAELCASEHEDDEHAHPAEVRSPNICRGHVVLLIYIITLHEAS